ncbi:MAG: hypothetical protein IPL32_06555 [Chloracidobacterium sp.]|nr:hypothetical protein [Chloracidobacterium sp.]
MRFLTAIFLLSLLFTAAFSQSTKPKPATLKPTTVKPKPSATPAKKLTESAEWDKAIAVTDASERIRVLRKFVTAFPKSTHNAQGFVMISTAEAGLGNEKLAGGDAEAAMKFIRSAVKDAPTPIPDQLFTDALSKFPANLYFRGLRNEGLEIAKLLESKAETNAVQLLSIAGFYLSIENGTEAKRVVENIIKIDANSSAAYQTLGLANRIEFKLEESSAAYAKAFELDPESLSARRGLAEMKRSLGLADDAVSLYREILAKEDANVPARTGLILALFDAGKRADAEVELARSLEANPNNVMLLAGAAYWYAAQNEGARTIELAQKALDTDPRFIWSHIAMARGLLSQNKPVAAERLLLTARKYGNFPTLEYEIASARLAAGLYREAAEELSKSFSIKDGSIHVDLGGRTRSEAKNFTELLAAERKASLFTPTAADNADNADQLKALLEFEQELKSPEPKADVAAAAADDLIRGDDKMKLHRQIFAASALLEKKIALSKVIEITRSAPSNLDAGLDVADPSIAVMAAELYEDRAIAAASGRYINVPSVPRSTLSSVLRGRIEEIAGWASFQLDDNAKAVLSLKRAVGVLPANSAWWRSSTWRLGTALAASGNDAEALEAYIKSYKSSSPDIIRYSTIEAVYKRVKGSTLGLEEIIGPNPSLPAKTETVAQKPEPTPVASLVIPVMAATTPTTEAVAFASPTVENTTVSSLTSTATTEAMPESVVQQTPLETPKMAPTEAAKPTTTPTAKPKELFPPVVITIPAAENSKTVPKVEATAEQTPTVALVPTPEIKPCTLTVDKENVPIKNNEGISAVIVKGEGNEELVELKAVSNDPEDLSIKREVIEGLTTQALFVVRSISSKTGDYKITFEMPCGKKEITVKVQ